LVITNKLVRIGN